MHHNNLLAIVIVTICLSNSSLLAQDLPQVGHTVNAYDASGSFEPVSGTLLEIDLRRKNPLNNAFVYAKLRRYNHARKKSEVFYAWYRYGNNSPSAGGSAISSGRSEVRYLMPENLTIEVNNNSDNRNFNLNEGGGSKQPISVSVENNNADHNVNTNRVVNPYATGLARYGYCLYDGYRYPIRRYYVINGVRRGYYHPVHSGIVYW